MPLPAYGACDLGSINLTTFIKAPFDSHAQFDMDALAACVPVAVRLLDNVLDVSCYPLAVQKDTALACRRIGLGVTGLADALLMLGYRYGDPACLEFVESIMQRITCIAYQTSITLAKEKGSFPLFDAERYLQGVFVSQLPEDIKQGIRQFGIRNSHLLAIAPAGTISLFANTISSGIEPVFAYEYQRSVLDADGTRLEFKMQDYACRLWRQHHADAELPAHFVTAHELGPKAHLNMQAALQKYVDNSISKTINVAEDYPFEEFQHIYMEAYQLGLKGCTTFRNNPVTGTILDFCQPQDASTLCCAIDREAD